MEELLGDGTPAAAEAREDDNHAAAFKTELLPHWFLKGIFSPRPIAVGLDFTENQWRAEICEVHAQKLALSIALSESEDYESVLTYLKSQSYGPIDDGIDVRLANLRRMKDPTDKLAYSRASGFVTRLELRQPGGGAGADFRLARDPELG